MLRSKNLCFLFQTILLFTQRITDLTNSINSCSLNSWFKFKSKDDHWHMKHDSSLSFCEKKKKKSKAILIPDNVTAYFKCPDLLPFSSKSSSARCQKKKMLQSLVRKKGLLKGSMEPAARSCHPQAHPAHKGASQLWRCSLFPAGRVTPSKP